MATILLIDDSDAHRRRTRAHVEAAGLFKVILEASNGLEGARKLMSEEIDVVLCDLEMPGLNGEKLLRLQSQRNDSSNVPFLFLTGSGNVDRRVRILEDGACDAIAKPYHPADLIARLRLHLKVKRLQDELRVKNETLARLSSHDALTGLRTRRFARDFLAIEFLRARRYGTPLTVMMADLDHFKKVNDSYGHPAGDAVLAGVAARLLENVRATDIASRYGGEEMQVVLPQESREGTLVMAERWRQAVEAAAWEIPGGGVVKVTVSAGVAEYHSSQSTPDDLVAKADRALYRAKESGRNRVC